MGTVVERNGKFSAKIRRTGFPPESKTFRARADAVAWIAEREAMLLGIREGSTSGWSAKSGAPDYLHVKTGKPRAILLRQYQAAAIDSAHRSLAANHESAPLVCLPTGSGKTVVIAGLIERLLLAQPDARFLVVTHTQELVAQDYAKFLEYACVDPEYVGVASAGLGHVEMNKKITFGTIQTLASRGYAQWVDYVLIDEAHMLPPRDESLYRSTLNKAKEVNSKVRVVGFTATPYRLDSGLLTEGKSALFSEICYEANIRELVRDKYLATLISTGSLHHVDDSKLLLKGGDFDEAVAEAEMEALTPSILDELKQYGRNRKAWLLFCVSIAHAEQVASNLAKIGVDAAVVSSAIPQAEREAHIKRFRDGALRALVNVNVLTTGFDAPQIDLIVSLRPTVSTALWVQICGRGMRISSGKRDCLVLDYANNIARHGPIDEIQIGNGNTQGNTSVHWNPKTSKPCPTCQTLCGARTLVCPNCGTPIQEGRSIELAPTASALPVLKFNVADENNQKRVIDLRDILSYYVIDDISTSLRERAAEPHVLSEFLKYARTYQSLVDSCATHNGVYDYEIGYGVTELAADIGKAPAELQKQIKGGTFPKPRLMLSDETVGYSLLQVAVIRSGDAQRLLHSDDTFLWYQQMIRILELELAASNALGSVLDVQQQ
ncbi:MAG TPA: DEAD/DEAH box helicase [Rhodocyclaceae bacterium]|nr:DEAD/DEAH box helicase [Rhodocyclaceae bacterium]